MTVSLSVSFVIYAPPLTPTFEEVFNSLHAAILDAQQNQALDAVSITLVDNGNNEAILEKVIAGASCAFPVTVIKNQENVGYSAHNQAIEQSNADYHLILNPDVLLSTSSLIDGLTYLEDNQDTVMICPYSEGEQGQPSHLCKRYPTVFDLALRGFASETIKQRFDDRLMHYEYRDSPTTEIIRSVKLISGCCILARTKALQLCDGFDEKFFLYFEDFDLSLRMSKLGNLDYYPGMKIVHYGGDAASKGFQHILYFVKSAARFYKKHGVRII
jgi:GT2 family glycosyltransferase